LQRPELSLLSIAILQGPYSFLHLVKIDDGFEILLWAKISLKEKVIVLGLKCEF